MRRRTLAALALALLPTAACSVPDPVPGGRPDEATVAEDEDATAAQIIEAGHPQDVAVSGDRTLVVYGVSPEDDEGPFQAAWRIYDADGRRVADASLGVSSGESEIEVDGLADGFLVRNNQEPRLIALATDGTPVPVRQTQRRVPTRPGDLSLYVIDGPAAFYRPGDHATYLFGGLPRMTQQVGIDDPGTAWAQVPLTEVGPDYNETLVLHSATGQAPWTREVVRFPGHRAQSSYDLAVSGARVLFSTFTGNAAGPRPAAVMSHGDRGWSAIPLDGVTRGHDYFHVLVSPQGRLLFSNGRTWLQQDHGWKRLDVPDGGHVVVSGGRLFRIGDDLSVSDDEGDSWEPVRR